jgi:hypothetical protein
MLVLGDAPRHDTKTETEQNSIQATLAGLGASSAQSFNTVNMKRIPVHSDYGIKYAIVDNDDYFKMSLTDWEINKDGYVCSVYHITMPTVRMHRQIMGLKRNDGVIVDHINHNKLDNRKCNLRICTNSENIRNSVPHKNKLCKSKGVYYYKGRFTCRITVDNKMIYLGRFSTERMAAIAYNLAAKKYFKEFSYLNKVGGLNV